VAYLTQYSNSVPVIKFNIDQSLMTIGQDIDMDICVPEDGVADKHAAVEAIKQAESYCFSIKSKSLIKLNDVAVSDAELHDGDWLIIGGVEFQFTDDGVNEIKEKTVTALIVEKSKPAQVEKASEQDKSISTKEFIANSRLSRRRLAI
jgi:pSer/pThr/pTyr-binding forkhead associated (FHA) protein